MADNTDFKLLKKQEIDKGTTLKITQNLMTGRIFVEFALDSPRLLLQKNFQDTVYGKIDAEVFSKSITSTEQIKEYFGLNRRNK